MTGGMVGSEYKFPAFDDLPKIEGMPQGSIWGFYDKNGKKDEVGGPFFCSSPSSLRNHSQLTLTSRKPTHSRCR